MTMYRPSGKDGMSCNPLRAKVDMQAVLAQRGASWVVHPSGTRIVASLVSGRVRGVVVSSFVGPCCVVVTADLDGVGRRRIAADRVAAVDK